MAVVILATGLPVEAATAAPLSHCAFSGSSSEVTGSCGHILDQSPQMRLAATTTISHGAWRAEARPTAIWAGDMTDDGYPNAFVQLEVYAGNAGILRTVYGWFAVTNFSAMPSGLSFDLDATREVPPNAVDREIVKRAAAILSSASAWNRADDRNCSASATTRSIYCAMEKASTDVTGGADHRRPAMEAVREVVEDRSAGRGYHHRLMDYNNDPRTTLADIAAIFAEALTRFDDAAWLQSHGFAPPR